MDNPDQTTSPMIRAASQEWRLSFLAGIERRRRDAMTILLVAWSTDLTVQSGNHYQGMDR
jgi:hypothetical protein